MCALARYTCKWVLMGKFPECLCIFTGCLTPGQEPLPSWGCCTIKAVSQKLIILRQAEHNCSSSQREAQDILGRERGLVTHVSQGIGRCPPTPQKSMDQSLTNKNGRREYWREKEPGECVSLGSSEKQHR